MKRPTTSTNGALAEEAEKGLKNRPEKFLDIEAEIAKVGDFGTFQKRYFVFMCFAFALGGAEVLQHAFAALRPQQVLCTANCPGGQLTSSKIPYGCGEGKDRTEYEYIDAEFSLITAFDLTCENQKSVPLIGSVFFLGGMLGFSVFTQVADVMGRRKAFYISFVVHQLAATLAPFTLTVFQYMITRFLLGLSGSGLGMVAYVILSEELPARLRAAVNMGMSCYFVLGVVAVSVLSALYPWREVLLILAGLSYLFGFLLAMPLLESTKWLHAKGRTEEVRKNLEQIAKINGTKLDFVDVDNDDVEAVSSSNESLSGFAGDLKPSMNSATGTAGGQVVASHEDHKQKPPWFIWTHPVMGPYHIVMCLLWFSCNLAYYGVAYDIQNIQNAIEQAAAASGVPHAESTGTDSTQAVFGASSFYMMQIQASLLELPASFAAMKAVDWAPLGRKGTVWGAMLISGFVFLLAGAMQMSLMSEGNAGGMQQTAAHFSPSTVLYCVYVGKFFITIVFGSVYVYASELFPTEVRGGAMGQQGFVGRLGALSLSLVIALNERIPGLPLIAFAIPCIFTALQCRQILPETQGKPLLNTIAEVDRGGERGFSKKEIFLLIVFPMLTCLVTPAVKYDKLPTFELVDGGELVGKKYTADTNGKE